ncbi:thiol peroxidase [Helicobacter sp. MIT 14-3879]|uniref:thiol peroxidase n=1 Tax=Helicobacter sp. MIT 14-3879 TaxID=2040649 RepID=UPI000E1EF7A8|nr:thiol peroxidase [Helicobacter sp. MIT 14-3879]RDU61489.1 thiol peroxidase [Helicobacter sp. MIT 14-3879]
MGEMHNKIILIIFVMIFNIVVFSGCGSKDVIDTKLSFLNELEKSRVNFSEKEKIERIIAFYKKKLSNVENLDIAFVEKIRANNDLDFDAFVFDFKVNGVSQREILFIKDNFFFSDFASIETLHTSKEKAVKILEKQANEEILKALDEDKNYIITLGFGKKEIFVFSDPLCQFCREHLKDIDEKYLKTHTIHFIFVSVHGEEGFNRASLIYENIKNLKNDTQKLELIKSYYSDSINQEPLFQQVALDLKILFDKYLNLGVKYVPYIIEK